MSNQEEFLKRLFQMEYVDNAKIAVVASAKSLPNGEWGMCLLCLNSNHLAILNTDMKQTIGQKLYDIDLTRISDFKSSTFVFNSFIKFTFNNHHYTFTNFGNAKRFVNELKDRIDK